MKYPCARLYVTLLFKMVLCIFRVQHSIQIISSVVSVGMKTLELAWGVSTMGNILRNNCYFMQCGPFQMLNIRPSDIFHEPCR